MHTSPSSENLTFFFYTTVRDPPCPVYERQIRENVCAHRVLRGLAHILCMICKRETGEARILKTVHILTTIGNHLTVRVHKFDPSVCHRPSYLRSTQRQAASTSEHGRSFRYVYVREIARKAGRARGRQVLEDGTARLTDPSQIRPDA
jgi:hypothetical protein